jgi:hypothetical protein
MDPVNLPAFFQVRIHLFRLTGTTLLFVHGVHGIEEMFDLLSRLLGHPLETLKKRGDFGVRRLKVHSSGLFHATKKVVRAHTQSVCEPAQGLCIWEPMAGLEVTHTYSWHVCLPRKPFLCQASFETPLSKPPAEPFPTLLGFQDHVSSPIDEADVTPDH